MTEYRYEIFACKSLFYIEVIEVLLFSAFLGVRIIVLHFL